MEREVATHTCKLHARKKTRILGSQYHYFENPCEIKVCPEKWAYFDLKQGWLKVSAGTKMGSQNTQTYLPLDSTTSRMSHNHMKIQPDKNYSKLARKVPN